MSLQRGVHRDTKWPLLPPCKSRIKVIRNVDGGENVPRLHVKFHWVERIILEMLA